MNSSKKLKLTLLIVGLFLVFRPAGVFIAGPCALHETPAKKRVAHSMHPFRFQATSLFQASSKSCYTKRLLAPMLWNLNF